MRPIYFSAMEFMRKQGFDVWVPAFYHPNLPKEMLDPKPIPLEKVNPLKMVERRRRSNVPFYQPLDPEQMQRAFYTVEVMLDMFQKKIEFEIMNDEDVPDILDGLDRYLLTLKDDCRNGNENIIRFTKLAFAWRKELYKHYYRYMYNNPTARAALYPNHSETNNINHLLRLTSGIREKPKGIDPLADKANPPFELVTEEAAKPDRPGSSMEFESSLGLSHGKGNPDIDDDFHFENFVSGK